MGPGSRLGPYDVLAPLGAGGMGEVYRARDPKLNRDVALKILPAAWAADPERQARFEREAKTLAALNHPHIAQIYGFEQSGATSALVMELVEGDDLAHRVARGPIPLDEALPIARQLAEALAAAHGAGVIHRDLKPANIKVRGDGTVKVLDFGLAKPVVPPDDPLSSPTLTSPLTLQGTILGTAAYMAPEQAKGRPVDHRADIWAFGCVLYEMLSGRRAFGGDGTSEVIAAVLRDPPPLDTLPPEVPVSLHRLLRRCLQKDPGKRIDSMHAAGLDLDEAAAEHGRGHQTTIGAPARVPATPVALSWRWLAVVVAASAAGAMVAWLITRDSTTDVRPAVSRLELSLSPVDSLGPGSLFERPAKHAFAVTPDGRRLVFAGVVRETTQIFVRSLDSEVAVPIAGTEGGASPFLSPDGTWIGFFADGLIRKVPLAGGPVTVVTDLTKGELPESSTLITPATNYFGASWGEDEVIVFGRYSGGLWQVPAAGGLATPYSTASQDDFGHRQPQHLPGRRGLLLTLRGPRAAVLPTGETNVRVVLDSATNARYVAPGHLVFARDGQLMAAPFDLESLSVNGEPVALVNDVMEATGSARPAANSGAAQFAVAASGTLVYASGGMYPPELSRPVWVDRSGRIEPLDAPPGGYTRPRLSPDGRHVAVTYRPVSPREPSGIFIFDLERRAATRLTRDGEWGPLWSTDGSRVLFMQNDGLGQTRADGSGSIERLRARLSYPLSVSPDGTMLAFHTLDPQTGADIWLMTLADRTERPLVRTAANETWAEISPDGRWFVYGANTSGRYEIYIDRFPNGGMRQRISVDGGSSPLWSRSGRELFFVRGAALDEVWVVDVTAGNTFTAGTPRRLFTGRFGMTGAPTAYDISLDGSRLLMTEELEPPKQPVTRLHVVLNWQEELKQRVPAR
jgi:eukaryotic-like serine/threonine-protein kinase